MCKHRAVTTHLTNCSRKLPTGCVHIRYSLRHPQAIVVPLMKYNEMLITYPPLPQPQKLRSEKSLSTNMKEAEGSTGHKTIQLATKTIK